MTKIKKIKTKRMGSETSTTTRAIFRFSGIRKRNERKEKVHQQ
jgi:hypothetical protein